MTRYQVVLLIQKYAEVIIFVRLHKEAAFGRRFLLCVTGAEEPRDLPQYARNSFLLPTSRDQLELAAALTVRAKRGRSSGSGCRLR